MKWRVRGSLGIALFALGAAPVALSSGCGGGTSLADRLTRLAGTYQGVGTLSGADASLSLTVTSDGVASGTLAASGTSTALSGRVTAAGALALTGVGASAQGTLSESGGTVSVLLGAARATISVSRPATPAPTPTPTGTPTPSPAPTPTPTPDPGPTSLSAALFPLHTGDVWRWSVTGGTENSQSEAAGVEAVRDGRSVLPLERRDSGGRPIGRDYIPTNQSGGYGTIEQETVLPTDGTTLARTVFGQALLVSYLLARGQEGPTNTLGGSRTSTAYLGGVTVTFAASFLRSERVSVGAGTFDCAVVRTVQTTGYTQGGVFQSETSDVTEWRAPGIGPVKRTTGGVTWTLQSATVGGVSFP